MPHVVVKLWPGRTEEQKVELSKRIVTDLVDVLNSSEESISVAIEEVDSEEWKELVYHPEIIGKSSTLYKKPGYTM